MPIGSIGDQEITTIEGLDSMEGKAIQAAWDELAVVQCGYCQSGQIMSATALLKTNPTPNDADIDAALSGNICRCATYARIRNAVKHASRTISVKEV
jgi:isoquinoline 1-oxidoreductase alpha subunit